MKAIRSVMTIVSSIESAGTDIVLLDLVEPDGWELPPFVPGGHIDLHLPNGLIRSYSLCGNSNDRYRYQVAIKREDAGRGGSLAAHRLMRDDIVPVSLPRGSFELAKGAVEHVFIAGGIGITPLLAMARHLESQDDKYSLHVLHRGKRPLEQLCASSLLTKRLHWYGADHIVQPSLESLLGSPTVGRHIYCCGPQGMIDAFEVATRNWPTEQVHVEHFVPPARVHDADAKGYTVKLALSNKELWIPPNGNLLHALRKIDVEVDASCEGGICGACRVRWREGQPVHHDRILSDLERESEVIVCVSGCASERLTLEL